MNAPRFSLNGDGKSPHSDQPAPKGDEVVQVLQDKFDQLNGLWAEAERWFKRIPLPVNVSVVYKSVIENPDPGGNGYECRHLLGYACHGQGWRLCYGIDYEQCPGEPVEWRPVSDCSADIRLEAAAHLEKLRDKVLEAAGKCVSRLDRTISEFRTSLKSWN